MMQEQAIVHKLFINRIGQRVYFQIRLPKDTKRIIGLEYNAQKIWGNAFLSRLPFGWEGDTTFKRYKNKLIGRLSLASSSCAGIFYKGNLIEDRNKQQYESFWSGTNVESWIQCTRREEIGMSVSTGLIQGLYEDSYGINEYTELEYELAIYLWIEKCTT